MKFYSNKLSARGYGDSAIRTVPIVPPISRGVCAVFDEPEDLLKYVGHNNRGRILVQEEYARYGNQTVAFVAINLLYLEAFGTLPTRGELTHFLNSSKIFKDYSSALTSDGMRAIHCAIEGLLFRHPDRTKRHHATNTPAHIIIGKECYKQTRNLIDDILKPSGVEVTVINTEDYSAVERFFKPNTRMVFIELPTNPFLRIPDLEQTVKKSRAAHIPVILDATFASPLNLRLFSLDLVPDVTVHSATKFLNGHNDVQAGFVWGRRDLMLGIDQSKGRTGGQISPDAAYSLFRGLQTYNLRIEAHNKNGLKVACSLQGHPLIERVWYPFEKSHPDYRLARRYLSGGGGVVSFAVKSSDPRYTAKDVDYFLSQLQCFDVSASFGGTSGMVQRVLPTSYSTMPEDQRRDLGITDNLVRMSVGIQRNAAEYVMDIMAALGKLEARIVARQDKTNKGLKNVA